jgi:hypothetical protein
MELHLLSSPVTKSKSKWIKDQNLRPETTRSTHGGNTSGSGMGKGFLDKTAKVQEQKQK